jgi:hypothetical protein
MAIKPLSKVETKMLLLHALIGAISAAVTKTLFQDSGAAYASIIGISIAVLMQFILYFSFANKTVLRSDRAAPWGALILILIPVVYLLVFKSEDVALSLLVFDLSLVGFLLVKTDE